MGWDFTYHSRHDVEFTNHDADEPIFRPRRASDRIKEKLISVGGECFNRYDACAATEKLLPNPLDRSVFDPCYLLHNKNKFKIKNNLGNDVVLTTTQLAVFASELKWKRTFTCGEQILFCNE